jgi:hypothetical protein
LRSRWSYRGRAANRRRDETQRSFDSLARASLLYSEVKDLADLNPTVEKQIEAFRQLSEGTERGLQESSRVEGLMKLVQLFSETAKSRRPLNVFFAIERLPAN